MRQKLPCLKQGTPWTAILWSSKLLEYLCFPVNSGGLIVSCSYLNTKLFQFDIGTAIFSHRKICYFFGAKMLCFTYLGNLLQITIQACYSTDQTSDSYPGCGANVSCVMQIYHLPIPVYFPDSVWWHLQYCGTWLALVYCLSRLPVPCPFSNNLTW